MSSGTPPQASVDLDLGAGQRAPQVGSPVAVPATTTQIAAELCTFREDVHGLRRDQRAMTDNLLAGQERISEGQEAVVERLDALIGGNTRIIELLSRIADSSELMAEEMDKLEDVMRRRVEQEDEHLRRSPQDLP